jgi:hypothetical protein
VAPCSLRRFAKAAADTERARDRRFQARFSLAAWLALLPIAGPRAGFGHNVADGTVWLSNTHCAAVKYFDLVRREEGEAHGRARHRVDGVVFQVERIDLVASVPI